MWIKKKLGLYELRYLVSTYKETFLQKSKENTKLMKLKEERTSLNRYTEKIGIILASQTCQLPSSQRGYFSWCQTSVLGTNTRCCSMGWKAIDRHRDMRYTDVQRRSVATLVESVSTGTGDRPYSGESTARFLLHWHQHFCGQASDIWWLRTQAQAQFRYVLRHMVFDNEYEIV